MGFKSRVNPLHTLLRECYSRSHPRCLSQRRAYATDAVAASDNSSLDVAVLGGGITGLTSAYLLSRHRPDARITLYEQKERLGGWMQSSEIEVDDGRIIFEHGPRSLRPSGASGMATLDLIRRLGLEDDVLTTSKASPAARNRYVYYPDHLVRMPGPGMDSGELLQSFLTERIWRGVAGGALLEFFRPPRPSTADDESIGSFLRRRFSAPLADNIVSAVLHGIYAGDIDKLSVRALMPGLWQLEKDHGSITRGILTNIWHKRLMVPKTDLDFLRMLNKDWHDEEGRLLPTLEKFNKIIGSSVYTFRAGLEQLSTALVDELESAPNVQIRRGTPILHAEPKDDVSGRKVELLVGKSASSVDARATGSHPSLDKQSYHRVISALPEAPVGCTILDGSEVAIFSSITPDNQKIRKKRIDMVTVMVVNLYFPNPSLLPVEGFGYLIPRAIPFSQNPERALGVVFDSDAVQGQDSAPGTKLTVMIGGHWWADWDSYPDEQEGLKMARAVLERHLGIRETPTAWRATLQRDCIPQYHVGHGKALKSHHQMLSRLFGGRLTVAGAKFSGVAVNDCVRSAYNVAAAVSEGKNITGLEDVGDQYSHVARV